MRNWLLAIAVLCVAWELSRIADALTPPTPESESVRLPKIHIDPPTLPERPAFILQPKADE